MYSKTRLGCVSLTLPGTTGAGTLHYCGAQAKVFCRNSVAQSDPCRWRRGRSTTSRASPRLRSPLLA